MPKEIEFEGVKYVLNQCQSVEGIWQWFQASKVGEFTRYFSNTIIHTAHGFCAAPSNDLTNWCYV